MSNRTLHYIKRTYIPHFEVHVSLQSFYVLSLRSRPLLLPAVAAAACVVGVATVSFSFDVSYEPCVFLRRTLWQRERLAKGEFLSSNIYDSVRHHQIHPIMLFRHLPIPL